MLAVPRSLQVVKTALIRGSAAVAAVLALAGPATADWSQYRGDAQRSAYARWPGAAGSREVNAPVGRVVWQRDIGRWSGDYRDEPPMQRSSPIVGRNGTVYLGASRAAFAHLFAFRRNGTRRWRSRVRQGRRSRGYAVSSAPALRRDGRMLVIGEQFSPCCDGGFRPARAAFVVSARTGRVIARARIPSGHRMPEGSSPLLLDDGGHFLYRSSDGISLWVLPGSDLSRRPTPILVAKKLPELTGGPGICFSCAIIGDPAGGGPKPPYPVSVHLPAAAACTRCDVNWV